MNCQSGIHLGVKCNNVNNLSNLVQDPRTEFLGKPEHLLKLRIIKNPKQDMFNFRFGGYLIKN